MTTRYVDLNCSNAIKRNETNNNKEVNTTFKIIANENEKKIEGVG